MNKTAITISTTELPINYEGIEHRAWQPIIAGFRANFRYALRT